jgi:hypothetical protein
MSTLGEIRDGMRAALGDIPARVQVRLCGGDYDDGIEKFAVRVLVGEPSLEAEEVLDSLLAHDGPVRGAFAADPTLGGVVQNLAVRSHSGHQAFKQPDESVLLGSEFLVEIYR